MAVPLDGLGRSEDQHVPGVGGGHFLPGEQDEVFLQFRLLAEPGQVAGGPHVMMVCEHETLQALVPDLLSQRQGGDLAAIRILARVSVDFEKQAVFHPEETTVFNQSRISL